MKQKWKTYLFWILCTEAVGLLAGWLIRDGVRLYTEAALKPPLSPPAAVFPVVWAILYALMGIGAAEISMAPPSPQRRRAMGLFLAQLGFNFLWSILFFRFQAYALAFFWLVALWLLILGMIRAFRAVDLSAARLQIPYLLWVLFAGYLNLGVWLLNR